MDHVIPPPITEFQGEYRFLSNFWPAPVKMGKWVFPSSEHAYQAAKSLDEAAWSLFANTSSPGRAKRLGRSIRIRPDWEQIKFKIMAEIVALKFDQHADLRARLAETAPRLLIEGNSWGDRIWGQTDGRGENHLGRILMAYRDGYLSKYIEENS